MREKVWASQSLAVWSYDAVAMKDPDRGYRVREKKFEKKS